MKMLPFFQDVVGVWESHPLPAADGAEAAVWSRRKLRVRRDGTFTIYGLNASGRWRRDGNRLILTPAKVFGQEAGTPLYVLMGRQIAIDFEKDRLGAATWSFRKEPYPIRWERVSAPPVSALLTILAGEETNPEMDYAYDELNEGGAATANELAYLLRRSPSPSVAFWSQTFLSRRPDDLGLVELLHSLQDPNPRIARTAAYRLRDLPDPLALGPLVDYMKARPKNRVSALGAIAKIATDDIVPILRRELAGAPKEYGAVYALEGLAARKDAVSRPMFLRYANDPRDNVRVAALSGLARTGKLSDGEVAKTARIAGSGSWLARVDAVKLLAETRKGWPTLVALLDDGDWVVRREAAYGVARFGPVRNPALRKRLRKMLWDSNSDVRNAAAKALRTTESRG